MMLGLSTRMWKWLAGALGVLLISVGAYAASTAAEKATRTAKPTIIIEKGDKCVEETSYMRKNHMKLLMHQRDETMHRGIRTEKHSLQNCINCHASSKNNSVIGTDENFCQGCHTYAAVKMDCWECHATKPKQVKPPAAPAVALPVAGGKQ